MPHHAQTGSGAPEVHAQGDQDQGAHAQGAHESDSGANSKDEVTPLQEKQLRLLFTIPILLGLFICALNILVVTRLWRAIYFSNIGMLSRANLPNTVCFTMLTISFAIGLALIVYAVALRHYEEWYDLQSDAIAEAATESAPVAEPKRIPSWIKWFVVPLVLAVPAPVLTVWATSTVEPISPTPCIEFYQRALEIKRDNPRFRMVWNDRDQLRCSINQVLEQ